LAADGKVGRDPCIMSCVQRKTCKADCHRPRNSFSPANCCGEIAHWCFEDVLIIAYPPPNRKAKAHGFKQKKRQISDNSLTALQHEIRHACNDADDLTRRALEGTVSGGWMNEGMSPCNAEAQCADFHTSPHRQARMTQQGETDSRISYRFLSADLWIACIIAHSPFGINRTENDSQQQKRQFADNSCFVRRRCYSLKRSSSVTSDWTAWLYILRSMPHAVIIVR